MSVKVKASDFDCVIKPEEMHRLSLFKTTTEQQLHPS